MPAPSDTPPPLASALARRFATAPRRDAFADSARAANQRRNLNLDMIALMERGHSANSSEVTAIRQQLAALRSA